MAVRANQEGHQYGVLHQHMQQLWYNDRWNEQPVLQDSNGFNTDVNTCDTWWRAIMRTLNGRDDLELR